MITKLKYLINNARLIAFTTICGSYLISGAVSSAGAAQSAVVWWQPSPSTNATGYKIYYGVASGSYTNSISVGNVTNVTVSGLTAGTTYYFAGRAIDAAGAESAYSPEVSYVVPSPAASLTLPSIAANSFSFTVNGISKDNYVVEMSSNLINWIPLLTNVAPFTFADTNPSSSGQRFYRAVHSP